jgi:hypothetical protein
MPILSDSPKRTAIIKKRKGELGWYPDSVKMDAIKLWLITGNLRAVSASLDIPYQTLQKWRYADWWGQMAEELRTEGHIQLSNKLKNIASKALDITLERLENGDYVLNQKTGEMVRKPVVMRDAHRVAESLIDRGLRISDKPIEEMNNQKIQDRLASLASAFESFAKKTRKVEVLDAVYAEREAGLQSRGELGEDQETFETEGPGEEDSGPESSGEGDRESVQFTAR